MATIETTLHVHDARPETKTMAGAIWMVVNSPSAPEHDPAHPTVTLFLARETVLRLITDLTLIYEETRPVSEQAIVGT